MNSKFLNWTRERPSFEPGEDDDDAVHPEKVNDIIRRLLTTSKTKF